MVFAEMPSEDIGHPIIVAQYREKGTSRLPSPTAN